MNLIEHLSEFARVMIDSGHTSSWGTSKGTYDGESAVIFIFVSHDKKRAEKAMRVLGKAGLLCETPLKRDGATPETKADVVQCVVEGLRATR